MKSVLVLAFTFAIGALLFSPGAPTVAPHPGQDVAVAGAPFLMGDPIIYPPPPPPPPPPLQLA